MRCSEFAQTSQMEKAPANRRCCRKTVHSEFAGLLANRKIASTTPRFSAKTGRKCFVGSTLDPCRVNSRPERESPIVASPYLQELVADLGAVHGLDRHLGLGVVRIVDEPEAPAGPRGRVTLHLLWLGRDGKCLFI